MKVDEGYSMEFAIPGSLLGVLGLVFIYFSIIDIHHPDVDISSKNTSWSGVGFGIFLIILSTLLFLIKTGIEFSEKSKLIRAYKSLFSVKVGNWTDLENVRLAYITAAKGHSEMVSRGGVRTHRIQFYELILLDNLNGKNIFYSFSKKTHAITTLNHLKNLYKIDVDSRMKRALIK